jgi:SAM-dependent methyltransferase
MDLDAYRCRVIGRPARPWSDSVFPWAHMALRDDGKVLYPVSDRGIPLLLAPEALYRDDVDIQIDLSDAYYAEAYEEMQHYNAVAANEALRTDTRDSARVVEPLIDAVGSPLTDTAWIQGVLDAAAHRSCYEHLGDVVPGGRVAQIGGRGVHAVKFLLTGAAEAWAISPMIGELVNTMDLAERVGVADRLRVACAIGEQLPFRDGSLDAIFIGASLHHMVVHDALEEIRRALRRGGRFAASEPWKSPGYDLGTRILGKRDRNVHCRPLDSNRLDRSMLDSFPYSEVRHHGAFSRYGMIAASKAGFQLSVQAGLRFTDWIDRAIPRRMVDRFGSSVAILCER